MTFVVLKHNLILLFFCHMEGHIGLTSSRAAPFKELHRDKLRGLCIMFFILSRKIKD
jgi:hypothetical protein